MSGNLNDNIKESLPKNTKRNKVAKEKEMTNSTFVIKRKKDDKINKKSFQTVMEATLLKELDTLAKKSGYSRNEMVNMMIDHCVKSFEIEE